MFDLLRHIISTVDTQLLRLETFNSIISHVFSFIRLAGQRKIGDAELLVFEKTHLFCSVILGCIAPSWYSHLTLVL